MAVISYAIQLILLLSILSINPMSLICPSLFPLTFGDHKPVILFVSLLLFCIYIFIYTF